MRIESVHDEFLMYLRIERNCSPKTIEAYGGDMKTFMRALAEFGIEPEVDLTPYNRSRLNVIIGRPGPNPKGA